MTMIRGRQIGFVRPILKANGLEKDSFLGMIDEGGTRGRQRLNFME